ncbi:MAG: hypothetical protein G01um101419_580 [Parcubacteria group bacterium Gr01-1014_19]|nr:MAG: hypothetical protein G01um101419_580 [Parcubacteria group bacterium Gr01-1014_19]
MTRSINERLASREFLVSVQIDPPKPDQLDDFRRTINVLSDIGVDLVDINSSRRLCHDSLLLAAYLKARGLEVIPHITTRDSTINGLLSQIATANQLHRVKNFLVITGDSYSPGANLNNSPGVFESDSVGLIGAAMEKLKLTAGLDITLLAAVNQNNPDMELEKLRLKQKIVAGASMFMSQPVFDETQLNELLDFYNYHTSLPLLVGIWPLVDSKTLRAIEDGKVSGVVIPDSVLAESKELRKDSEGLRNWGLVKALQLVQKAKDKMADGVYIVAPSRQPLQILDFLKEVLRLR